MNGDLMLVQTFVFFVDVGGLAWLFQQVHALALV
jgi:hypothetical protein